MCKITKNGLKMQLVINDPKLNEIPSKIMHGVVDHIHTARFGWMFAPGCGAQRRSALLLPSFFEHLIHRVA